MNYGHTEKQKQIAQKRVRDRIRSKSKHGLIGKFFHQYVGDDHKTLHWQGAVLSEPQKGTYLVQLFEWFCGEPNDQVLVKFEDMTFWKFYDTAEDMHDAFDEYDDRARDRRAEERELAASPAV